MSLFWKCIDHYECFSSLLWSLCAFSCDKLACLSHKTFSLTNQIVHYPSPAPVISHAYTDAETPLVMQMTLCIALLVYTISSTAGGCLAKKVCISYKNNFCIIFCWIAFPLCVSMHLLQCDQIDPIALTCIKLRLVIHFHTLVQNTVFKHPCKNRPGETHE